MILIALDSTWPETIPLPYLEYSGRPRYSTITSPIENAFTDRRSRFKKPCLAVSVSWFLSVAEYDAFKVFFADTLGNGVALFSIEVRYPKNTELTEWTARFRGGYQAQPMDGVWNITSELELINETLLGALAPRVGAADAAAFDVQAGLVLEELAAPGYAVLEYLDIDLGAILEGTATADQILAASGTDDALGAILP